MFQLRIAAAIALPAALIAVLFLASRSRDPLAGFPPDTKLLVLKVDGPEMTTGSVVRTTIADARRMNRSTSEIVTELELSTQNRLEFTLDQGGVPHREMMTFKIRMRAKFEEGDSLDLSVPPGQVRNESKRVPPIQLRLSNVLLHEFVENGLEPKNVNISEFIPGSRQSRDSKGLRQVLISTRQAMETRGFNVEEMDLELSFPSLERLSGKSKLVCNDREEI